MGTSIANQAASAEKAALYRVFGWMTLGLAVSALTAYWTAATPAVLGVVLENQAVFLGLMVMQVIMVIALSWLIRRLSPTAAAAIFLAYSFASGLTLSALLIEFTGASLGSTFLITAGTFGLTALYGYFTQRDLSRWGSMLFMGLVGLILASLVNIFWKSAGFDYATAAIGVVIFTALTAYDLQKIKAMTAQAADQATAGRAAIYGALMLYLDFINIFLRLLSITGRKRG